MLKKTVTQRVSLPTLFLAEGVLTILLGTMALLLPPLAAPLTIILLGWLLMASGVVGFVTTLWSAHGFWWALLSAVITFIAGVMLFSWPLGGLFSLSAALAMFLALDGFLAIGLALEHRRHMTPRWIWLLANGVADLLFAVVITVWIPSSADAELALVLGADMMISGATLIALGADIGKARERLAS